MPIGVYDRTEKIKKILSESHKGLVGWWKGKRFSKEVRKKMSIAHKDNHLTKETRWKIAKSIKGIRRSKETRQKISQALEKRFIQMTEEEKLNYMLPATKVAQTLESRQKASAALKENWGKMTKEEKKNRTKLLSEAGQKACHSLEARQKMAKTKKEQYAKMTEKEKMRILSPWINAGRKNPSSIEKAIWKVLDEFNINYKIQISINNAKFIVDIYIPTQRIIIECNGDYWHNYEIFPKKKIRDNALEKYVNENNYKLIWLRESDIRKNPKKALEMGIKSVGKVTEQLINERR